MFPELRWLFQKAHKEFLQEFRSDTRGYFSEKGIQMGAEDADGYWAT